MKDTFVTRLAPHEAYIQEILLFFNQQPEWTAREFNKTTDVDHQLNARLLQYSPKILTRVPPRDPRRWLPDIRLDRHDGHVIFVDAKVPGKEHEAGSNVATEIDALHVGVICGTVFFCKNKLHPQWVVIHPSKILQDGKDGDPDTRQRGSGTRYKTYPFSKCASFDQYLQTIERPLPAGAGLPGFSSGP